MKGVIKLVNRHQKIKLSHVGKPGKQGDQGDKGDAATVDVGSTTTTEWDIPAKVTNSGDQNHAVFDFSIPRGQKGDTGPQGPQGPQGPKGDKGDDGPGVATGGAAGQILAKTSGNDFDTEWVDQPKGEVVSVNGKDGVVILDASDIGADQVGSAATAESNSKQYTDDEINSLNIDNRLDGKVDKEIGKGLSEEDYTSAEKLKLSGIEAGAEVNKIDSIVQGTNVVIDNTDPQNPIISATGGGGSAYTFESGLTEDSGTVKLGGEVEDGTAITLGSSGLTFHEVDLEPLIGEAGVAHGASLETELDAPGFNLKSGVGTIADLGGIKFPLANIYATYKEEDDTETIVTTGPLTGGVGVGSQLQTTDGSVSGIEQLTANYWSVMLMDNRGEDQKGFQIVATHEIFSFVYGNHRLLFKNGRIEGLGDGTEPDHAVNKSQLDTKVDKTPGKQLSDQNYTQDEKNKLAGIEAGSEVNKIDSIVQGTNITIDNTDPKNPVINASGGGGSAYTFESGLTEEDGTVKLGGEVDLDTSLSVLDTNLLFDSYDMGPLGLPLSTGNMAMSRETDIDLGLGDMLLKHRIGLDADQNGLMMPGVSMEARVGPTPSTENPELMPLMHSRIVSDLLGQSMMMESVHKTDSTQETPSSHSSVATSGSSISLDHTTEEYGRRGIHLGQDGIRFIYGSDIGSLYKEGRFTNVADPVEAQDVATKKYVDDNAGGGGSTVVKLTGDQTIADVKTFSSSPVVPTPNTDYQAATKKYVDDNVGDIEAALSAVLGGS